MECLGHPYFCTYRVYRLYDVYLHALVTVLYVNMYAPIRWMVVIREVHEQGVGVGGGGCVPSHAKIRKFRRKGFTINLLLSPLLANGSK